MGVLQLVQPLVVEKLFGCFQFWAITNKVVITIIYLLHVI